MNQSRNEARVVGLMALGFGLVGIDRFMISTLYPVIARDLHLGYGDIGKVTGALAIAWGIAALVMGNLSDRIGRRRVLAGALLLFALLISASGLAAGLASLILVRIVMGVADGAYTPVSIATTLEASAPHRRGLNIGIQQTMLPLFGLGIAPLIVSQLLHLMGWRLIFSLFAAPGLLLAWLVWRTLPKDVPDAAGEGAARTSRADWGAVLAVPNIRLGMAMMLCWLTCLVTTSALLPNYFTDYLHLPLDQMSWVMSATGFGAMVGTLLLPWLSDRIGRKPVFLIAVVGAGASLVLLRQTGAAPMALFGWLFAVHFFNNAAITLTVGPLCAESVPASLMATASGVVIACGELFGGGVAPVIGGQIAERFGINNILWLPIAAMGVALVLCALTRETWVRAGRAPAKRSAR